MMIREKKRAPQHKMPGGEPTPKPIAEPDRIPAPIRGLVLNESIANPQPGGARILDNFICDFDTVRPRKGYALHATVAADAVQSMWTYKSGATEKFFAASDDSIFEITSPADPEVIPTADVTGQTNGFWFEEQFGTAGGDYLYAVNGADSPQLYDGTTWTTITGVSSPAITGVTTSDLSHVWSFASRLFFVEEGTKSAWYLPVDSIGGAASEFSLAGIFKKGGSLSFGATWSTDSGDGPSDRCLFFSTEGEVAVYQGTNPGNAAEWNKVGVYEITRPLGPRAIMKAGGDLLVATEQGLVPMSEVVRKDVDALSLGAVSLKIEPLWQSQARALADIGWQVAKWSRENIMIVSQPEVTVTDSTCLVANLQTGAWTRFTAMDTQSLAVFSGDGYFGTSSGTVYKMQTTGADAGMPYTASYLGQFEGLQAPGREKTVRQGRATFKANTPIAPLVGFNVNYNETLPASPNAVTFTGSDGWDLSTWDVSLWDAEAATASVLESESRWRSIGATGYAHAPVVMMTFGSTAAPDVEYVGIDVTVRMGAMVA